MKGAVISADYLFYLTNHDRTHTSLWGCWFEQWLCATIGLLSFTSLLLLEWRSPEKCSPLFTKGNTQFSHNEIHSTQRSFTLLSPPSHGESLLSPFLHASYTRHKLLNPRNTVPWDSAGAILQGQWGWIWHISLCWTQLPSAWIRRERGGVEGNTVGELADFLPLPQQCEKQRKEPKLFAEVGQPRKDGKEKGRSTTLQK